MCLETLRRAWGGPVFVNSGWRCGNRNLEVGGTRTSRHLIGCAADVSIRPPAGPEWQKFTQLGARLCRHPGWEFLLYKTYIHIGAPRDESEKRWGGGRIITSR